jgi:hypothetical protein
MLTLFLLLGDAQHKHDSTQRQSDSSGVCSTHARVCLHGGTVAPVFVVALPVQKGSASECSGGSGS